MSYRNGIPLTANEISAELGWSVEEVAKIIAVINERSALMFPMLPTPFRAVNVANEVLYQIEDSFAECLHQLKNEGKL